MLDTDNVVGKDKEERRLSKVKIAIMRNPKFALWSGLMTVGKTRVSDDVPTACTNGRDETYGRAFIKELDDRELAFVVLHETLHKAFRHLFTWKKLWDEDKQLANMACDYVINLMLLDMDKSNNVIAMPQKQGKAIGLVDEKYRGLNAKQVFDLLKEDKKNGEGMFGEGQPCEGDGEGGQGFDDHDWEGAKELDAETKKELEREIDQALRQGVITNNKVNGAGAGGLSRELGELLEPEVDWRELLREFVKSTCSAKDASSWRRVNRRYLGTGVYMPSLIGERVGHLVIGIDTSGSIGGHELNEFLSEVKGIADEVHPEKVDLIYWDSAVAGHEVYDVSDVSNIVSSTKPMGGGGTDPTCVHHYLKENNIKPEAVIMLTDGCIGDWGNEWEAPMLWTVVRNPNAYAPMGKTIHIKD
jgi:predicted metal-dependent peptidase